MIMMGDRMVIPNIIQAGSYPDRPGLMPIAQCRNVSILTSFSCTSRNFCCTGMRKS